MIKFVKCKEKKKKVFMFYQCRSKNTAVYSDINAIKNTMLVRFPCSVCSIS